jgi:hypothetical protein
MPFRTIPGLGQQYALISFDKNGKERTDDPAGGVFSRTLIEKVKQEKPTHVFLFSHGWKGDFDAAVDQYDRWIGAMRRLDADRQAMGPDFHPLFIGLHWPSLPWGEEGMPGAASFAEAVLSPDFDALYEKTVEHFGEQPGVREALRVIFDAQKEDPGAVSLPDEVITAYHELGRAIGFSAGADPGAPPDAEGAPLDPEEAVRADRVASAAVPFGGPGGFFKGMLGGLRQLSFWTMKRRARTVGERGMHQYVAEIQRASNARVHLMGHSFGCVVMSSVAGGPDGRSILPRPVDSLALVQGAVSLWSYGEFVHQAQTPGYYHAVLLNKRVAGPIVTTQSRHDLAVGVYYPAAVGLVGQAAFASELPMYGAMGTFGIQGAKAAKPIVMLDEHGRYDFQPGGVYNVESSEFIQKMDGSSGAHSDIDGPQVAHMLWQAAQVSSVQGQGA